MTHTEINIYFIYGFKIPINNFKYIVTNSQKEKKYKNEDLSIYNIYIYLNLGSN